MSSCCQRVAVALWSVSLWINFVVSFYWRRPQPQIVVWTTTSCWGVHFLDCRFSGQFLRRLPWSRRLLRLEKWPWRKMRRRVFRALGPPGCPKSCAMDFPVCRMLEPESKYERSRQVWAPLGFRKGWLTPFLLVLGTTSCRTIPAIELPTGFSSISQGSPFLRATGSIGGTASFWKTIPSIRILDQRIAITR